MKWLCKPVWAGVLSLAAILQVAGAEAVAAEPTGNLTADLQPGFTTESRQTFSLRLPGARRVLDVMVNDRPARLLEKPSSDGAVEVVPNEDLRVGLNRVAVRLAWQTDGASTAATAETRTFFVNRQSARRTITFGERGELVVDGQRRFILGGYRSGQTDDSLNALPSAVEAGFDMVHEYRFETFDMEKKGVQEFIRSARTYLRKAEELGLGVFLGLPRNAVKDGDERVLARIVADLSNERALWMWYVYDEPRPEVLSFESAARVHELLRRLDPQRPSILLMNRDDTVRQYYQYCDVVWYDRYPIAATDLKGSSLKSTAAVRESAKQSLPDGKPVWSVLQAYDNKGDPRLRERARYLERVTDGNHRPNEAELRAQAHIAIAHQAMAAIYYWAPENWYSMRTDTPGVWRSLSRVLKELRELEPVLLSPESSGSVALSGADANVMMWTRVKDGRTYAGIVNADINRPARAALRITGDAPRVEKVLGDGTVAGTGRNPEIRLGPAGMVVVAIDAE